MTERKEELVEQPVDGQSKPKKEKEAKADYGQSKQKGQTYYKAVELFARIGASRALFNPSLPLLR